MGYVIIRTGIGMLLSLALIFIGCGKSGVLLRGDSTSKKGQVLREINNVIFNEGATEIDSEGQLLNGQITSCTTTAVETEILATDRVRVLYLVDSVEKTTIGFDEDGVKTTTNPLQGVPILGKLSNGKWIYSLETGVATIEQQKKLKSMSEQTTESLYPFHRVRVGDRWDIDPQVIKVLLGGNSIRFSGTGSMALNSLTQYEGHECAQLTLILQVTATLLDDENNEIARDLVIQAEILRATDIFSDLSLLGKGYIKDTADILSDGTKLKMSMISPIKMTYFTIVKQ